MDKKIRSLSSSHKVYPGLKAFERGKRVPVNVEDIPGMTGGGEGGGY